MIYFLKAIFDLIEKFKWWAIIIVPLAIGLVVWGVVATGGFNPLTGNEFLGVVFDLISGKQVDGE